MLINIKKLTLLVSSVLTIIWPLPIHAVPETLNAPEVHSAIGQPSVKVPLTPPASPTAFSYQVDGRPDPFRPFISAIKAVNEINMDEIVENEETLTGMQLFEPGQLKLVAIVLEDKTELAMVEDASGQGYAIHPGMKIGRKGVVTAIAANQVIIEETSINRAGKQLTKNTVMHLKKKGEE
jgi:type IV pilus assembly protein PilP